MLTFDVKRIDQIYVLSFRGKVSNWVSLATMKLVIHGLLTEVPPEEKPHIILNLRKLRGNLGAAGLHTLLACYRAVIQRRGDSILALIGLRRQRLMVTAKLAMTYPIYETEEAAKEAIKDL